MFLQLIMPTAGPPFPVLSAAALQNVDSLFLYTPLQISALVETVWRFAISSRRARLVVFQIMDGIPSP